MNWRCRIFGHAGPRWLDYQHQGHCPRCREPHPEWIKQGQEEADLRAVVERHVLGWWTMSGEDFMAALRRAGAGEDPEMIYAEWYANSDTERPED